MEAEEQGLGQFAGEPPEAPRLGETAAHQRPGQPRQAGDQGGIARAHPRPQVDGRFTHGLPFPAPRPGVPPPPVMRAATPEGNPEVPSAPARMTGYVPGKKRNLAIRA